MSQEQIDSIRYNLARSHCLDMEVQALISITKDGMEIRQERYKLVKLSVVCARHRQISTEVNHYPKKGEKANLCFQILRSGIVIGKVDDYGHFYYYQAPILEKALGWIIASSVGRDEHLDSYRYSKNAARIRLAVQEGKLSDEFLSEILLKNKNYFVSLSNAREMFLTIVRR